ncbi:MAG: hypothetical protein IAE89_04420 [Anaerolineae bacterium]|nr:hypothetical protein [Anaerolineae bacterium]
MGLAGDHVQVLVGGYEFTGDVNRITIADAFDLNDVTAFGDAVRKYIPGLRTSVIGHDGYFNAQAGSTHPVLKGVSVKGVLSVLLGQNVAPTVGDPVYSLDGIQSRYGTLPQFDRYIPFGALFANRAGIGGWGISLTPPTIISATTTGSLVDNGAASLNGGAGFLHILQTTPSDTYTFIIEGSTSAGFTSPTTLATFTLTGLNLNSQRISIAGTIPQYVRYKATRTGSVGNSVKFALNLVRF